MKNYKTLTTLAAAAGLLITSGIANASTVVSQSFNKVDSAAISTSGTAGWGFFNSDGAPFFDSNLGVGGNESWNNTALSGVATAALGGTYQNVTITEGTSGTDVIDNRTGTVPYTFDTVQAYGRFGSMASGEGDVWTLDFNDIGIGTFDIAIYLGHDASNRSFDMDYDLAGVTGTTTMSGDLASLGGTINNLATYNIQVTTTAATDDLSLTFGSLSGNSGHGFLAGYTVAAVPEPSAFALLAGMFGLTWVMLRRRA